MLILKLALRNLRRNTRKTILLGTLITLGMAFLLVSNTIFESTKRGLESSFVKSLTGDIVLGAAAETLFSLFGNDIPLIDNYEIIPSIAGYENIETVLAEIPFVEIATPIISAAAAVEIDSTREGAAVFGINPETYFKVCSDIKINKGNPSDIASGGIFLCALFLEKIETKLERTLIIGEEVKLSMYSNGSFKIRKGFFAGSHSYVNKIPPFNSIILADPSLVRGLVDYTFGNISGSEDTQNNDSMDEIIDLDDLFEDFGDTSPIVGEDVEEVINNEGFSLEDIEKKLADTSDRDIFSAGESTAWSYILFKAENRKVGKLKKILTQTQKKMKWDTRVVSWQNAAGLSAQAVFALQVAFNVGIVFIIIGAVLVIMNALVISVLERSKEIGTMRGLGAGKSFIRKLFIAESMLLTMIAATIGIIIGIAASLIITAKGIILNNELLITLFGGNVIQTYVGLEIILAHFAGAAIVGSLAWIYPVWIAVKIQPVTVMGRE